MVIEPGRVGDMGLSGDGGDDDQVAGPDQLLGALINGDLAGGAGRSR